MDKTFTALVLGGTGEIGKELVKQLVGHPKFTKVLLLVRRPYDEVASDKIDCRQVDFDNLQSQHFEGADVAYCCLGTTRAKSGKDGFIKVDKEYVFNCAELCKNNGCQQFHLVTSMGSNKNSMFLYQKTKGEVEEMVSDLKFARLAIYQPGLLLCDRKESRVFETIGQTLVKGFDLRNRMSIPTETVAKAMLVNTLVPPETATAEPFVEFIKHPDILRLGID